MARETVLPATAMHCYRPAPRPGLVRGMGAVRCSVTCPNGAVLVKAMRALSDKMPGSGLPFDFLHVFLLFEIRARLVAVKNSFRFDVDTTPAQYRGSQV